DCVQTAHRVPENDGTIQPQMMDELPQVLSHLFVGHVAVPRPLAIAVTALVNCDHAELTGEHEAYEIPTVCGLIAAVRKHDWGREWVAPLKHVEAKAVDHHVSRATGNARVKRDA